MLNCNKYINLLGSLFEYGVSLTCLSANINRFYNGALRFELTGPSILSPATGHYPFHTFHFIGVTGDLAAWQVSIMGVTFGSQLMPNVNEDGSVAGPDYRKHYCFFSCLNHKDQLLEEIINNG